ncbi:hypothetical protein FHN55_14750 [Streptomyces sp. NP160]|uniref:hypothetical protein n=1 Tax=Streptomyces sp. NP160 TaxID=2586637 RepID=UPI001117C97D|nr:hypothetical protein [Streptomyces sp. NP160]TNM64088.1 hypothetical protein FHN55_14750 [Streptomyces sp. NP160]
MADGVRRPSRPYLGEPVLGSFGDDTALLGCGCVDDGCGPFSAVVQVDDDVVTWSRYSFADAGTAFLELPDLAFDRRQYEAAVRATETAGSAAVYRHRGHRRVRRPALTRPAGDVPPAGSAPYRDRVLAINPFESAVLTLVPLLLWTLVVVALYWAVRMGVRHGLLDARRRQLPPDPGASGRPAAPTDGV